MVTYSKRLNLYYPFLKEHTCNCFNNIHDVIHYMNCNGYCRFIFSITLYCVIIIKELAYSMSNSILLTLYEVE